MVGEPGGGRTGPEEVGRVRGGGETGPARGIRGHFGEVRTQWQISYQVFLINSSLF